MRAVNDFAREAEAFVAWVTTSHGSGHAVAREALVRLTSLYLAAIALPPPGELEVNDEPDEDEDRKSASGQPSVELPFDLYAEVFDPFVESPEPLVMGSLTDDLADIFKDVSEGLEHYRAGRVTDAAWTWRFTLERHWGEHATGAIRALHCWLAKNGFDDDD